MVRLRCGARRDPQPFQHSPAGGRPDPDTQAEELALDAAGSETRFGVVTRGQSGSDVVLVSVHSAEDLLPADLVFRDVDRFGAAGYRLGRGGSWPREQVRPGTVVVPRRYSVSTRRRWCSLTISTPVEGLPKQGADDPFADRVGHHRQLQPIRPIGTVASG